MSAPDKPTFPAPAQAIGSTHGSIDSMSPKRASPVVTALLVLLTVAGLVALILGCIYAAYANSATNRQGNDLAGIAVGLGLELAGFGAIVASVGIIVLISRSRRR
jgi:hypothetical protein